MKYAKKPLTHEEQADLLLRRGLVADRNTLIDRLKAVNYYRLSGYLHPFRQPSDLYIPGTTLDTVWRHYNFDRRLRTVLLDAIERIEVALRTRLVYRFVQAHGAFGHLNAANLPGLNASEHVRWVSSLLDEKKRSREAFVKHFDKTYGDFHKQLPLWMACELMTCGNTLRLAYGMDPSILRQAASDFGFPDKQLLSWAKALFALRNSCAHHARVWNKVFGAKPSIPGKNKNPGWHAQPTFAPDRIGLLLCVCHYWLGKVSSTTQWKQRLYDLFDEYSDMPLSKMGIPVAWREHPLWK